MTAIVMNTLNGAVTEYDWSFQSITPTHAGSAAGLHEFGGNTDAGSDIDASFLTAETSLGSTMKRRIASLYFAMMTETADGEGLALVKGREGGEFSYPLTIRDGGMSRAICGKGLRESYIAFGYENVDGAHFRIDLIEPEIIESKQRRL